MFKYKLKEQSYSMTIFWNMAGTVCFAAQSMLLLALVSRICGSDSAGIFSLTYSFSQLMYMVGCFESSNILITDASKLFSLRHAALFRIITNGVAIVFSICFAHLQGFNGEKIAVFYLLVLHMVVLSLIDLFESYLHKEGYLNLAGKSRTFNAVIGTVSFALVLMATQNVLAAVTSMIICSMLWLVLFDLPYIRALNRGEGKHNVAEVMGKLLMLCAPLICMRVIFNYTCNSPKLAIDAQLSLKDQSIYGYLMMPASCINIVSLFIYRPKLVMLAEAYHKKDKEYLKRIIWKQLVYNIGIAAVVLAGGLMLGIPILSFVYGVDLSGNEASLCVILLGGCFYACSMFFETIATVMRCHKWLLLFYFPILIISNGITRCMVCEFALMGACASYMLLMALVMVGTILVCVKPIHIMNK